MCGCAYQPGIGLCGANRLLPDQGGRTSRRSVDRGGNLCVSAVYTQNHAQAGGGGDQLARGPESVTLRQVIEAVEGPYRFSRCLDGEYDCSCSAVMGCPFHTVFDDVTKTVIEKLDAVTFADL